MLYFSTFVTLNDKQAVETTLFLTLPCRSDETLPLSSFKKKKASEPGNCSAGLRLDLSTFAFCLFAIHSLCIGCAEAFHHELASCCTWPTLSCCDGQQSDEQQGDDRLNLFGGEKFNSLFCVFPLSSSRLFVSYLSVNRNTTPVESRS